MIIQAELKCKQTGCEADPCAVDKVIELPSPRFRQFSRALLADYDFIAENKDAIQRDEDARHCLLILDAEGTDGFLIDPQGYDYARYSAFVPNARSLLTPDMGIDRSYLSPAEPWRNENRDEILRMTLRVEGKQDYTLVLPADEEYLDAVKNYFDEFHVLLRDRLTASYCVAIWKMLRKKGCVPSALTQNVKDFLASPEIENIFENSDFLVLLSQAQGDRQILAKQLGISPHQLSYVTHTNSGEGLLFFGNTTIPFVDRFPQNTELYAIMTTRPEDKKQEMNRA